MKALEESAEPVHEYEEYNGSADIPEESIPSITQQWTPAPTPAVSAPASNLPVEMFAELEPPAQPAQDEVAQSGLTVQQVRERWGVVQQRVKQKNRQTAAMLNHYTVVGVENTGEEAVVMIQAAEVFYKMLNQGERPKHVEWGLSMEFQQKCRVRLLHSDESVPTPPSGPANAGHPGNPGNNGGGSTVSNPPPRAQQQSALVESAPVEAPVIPAPPAPLIAPAPPPARQKPVAQEDTSGQRHITQTADKGPISPLPLARKNVVRENSNAVSAAAAQAMLEQKAKNHPVVQEIMRTFTVKNVQVNPK